MDDFLYKLRNAKKSSHDRSRRNQDSYSYRMGDRKKPKGRKFQQTSSLNSDHLAAIRKTLETIAENQKQQMGTERVRCEIEERKALALEKIAGLVGNLKEKDVPREPADGSREVTKTTLPHRADRDMILKIIHGLRQKGQTYERIAEHLESEGIPTLSGKGKWRGQSIYRLNKETV